jgi:uncharacterized membrane protein YdjX (TVP38/TMEM64 family)
MRSRWRSLPPPVQMYVASGLVWFPGILLIVILGTFLGGSRHWTEIYMTVAGVCLAIGGTFVILGVRRAVRQLRSRTSGAQSPDAER